uniref:FtsK/SpoIIIE domain-containing protein n=1 Tax=Microbacterium azadirachtae TaxID=582680 RepID=UPI003B8483E8
MGVAEGGGQWRLPVGPHTLVAGSSGSGKASLVWGLLLGLAQPIHQGLVEVWGIDRKGGMELAMGRDLLTRFADDAAHSVALLEEAVTQMQRRARALAGVTRQHVAGPDSPTIIVLIDELAALTAYETDREMLRRANAAIATLASQGVLWDPYCRLPAGSTEGNAPGTWPVHPDRRAPPSRSDGNRDGAGRRRGRGRSALPRNLAVDTRYRLRPLGLRRRASARASRICG